MGLSPDLAVAQMVAEAEDAQVENIPHYDGKQVETGLWEWLRGKKR